MLLHALSIIKSLLCSLKIYIALIFFFFQSSAEKVYKKFVHFNHCVQDKRFRLKLSRCGLCGGKSNAFQLFRSQSESNKKVILNHPLTEKNKVICNWEVEVLFFFFHFTILLKWFSSAMQCCEIFCNDSKSLSLFV